MTEQAAFPRFQSTIARDTTCAGRGLHTGRPCVVTLRPAPVDAGVVFRRFVGGAAHDVPALWPNRRSRPLCTALQVGEGPLVRTVEHLLAALSAHAIDNVLIEIDAEELPIFDGSATPWVAALHEAGRLRQAGLRRYLRVLERVDYREGVHKQSIEPAPGFRVTSAVTLSHFGQLKWSGAIDADSFSSELAASRSFGRFKWAFVSKLVSPFRREPVLRGASFSNTAALWGRSAIGGLRFEDEPVRHRALDLVGDLSLAGMPILGHATAIRPGHEHNFGMLETLMSRPAAWEVVLRDEEGGWALAGAAALTEP